MIDDPPAPAAVTADPDDYLIAFARAGAADYSFLAITTSPTSKTPSRSCSRRGSSSSCSRPDYAGRRLMPDSASFLVARNPDPDSSLPYLLRVPLEGGILLKARDRWPTTARVYCHPLDEWPPDAEIVGAVAVRHCQRLGARSTLSWIAGATTARAPR